ncbi:IS66 family insertion sequence element accessory protein TnpA [Mesonia aestuariivivens]|uniref:IS66 family insertion sequence element accessory protein TnpB n=1 Tax=Mesonia aestuariivivens TaxID=2796128 RepID=A0ABS6W4L6_9FLAO|nr:IS66 family insertion sequence element accessory protein TnpB [Mesonia aestuariivivens]MBW2962813.1 IS66 family insertion sequence element accessory protein TnpB [Mesonia aestuariivivens]
MSKEEEMFAMIDEFDNSSLTARDFCKAKGVVPSTFYYWKKKRYGQNGSAGFVTITPRPSVSKEVELIFPNGVQLRMNGLDPDFIAKLVQLRHV